MNREFRHYHKEQTNHKGQPDPKYDRHDGVRIHVRRSAEPKASDKDIFDHLLEELASEIDTAYMSFGKTIAELLRAMCEAAAKLPNIELKTDMLTLCNEDNRLSVTFMHDPVDGKKDVDTVRQFGFTPGCEIDEYDDDDEEGMLYDGD